MTRTRVYEVNDSKLSSGLKRSLLVHFVLMSLVLLKGLVIPKAPLPYIPTLKVDLVALPSQLTKDIRIENQATEKPPTETKSLPQVTKDMELPTNQRTRRNRRALDRIKALAKIQGEVDSRPIEGNKISKGLSLSGEAKEAEKSNYLEVLVDRLHPHWVLPTWLQRLDPNAQVLVRIDKRGRLLNFSFIKRSGYPQFDDLVVRALQESQPFPFPPADIKDLLLTDGVSLGFPL